MARSSTISPLAGVALCLLLAVAQVALAGYQMGVGNQAIQIAFLKRFADPTLYASDAMVQQTMPLYPSLFFGHWRTLLGVMDVSSLYLLLQLATSFLTLAAIYALGRAIFQPCLGTGGSGIPGGGPSACAGGRCIYSEGFAHGFRAADRSGGTGAGVSRHAGKLVCRLRTRGAAF